MAVNIDKIYDLMADKGFQEPRTGDLFFPVYIYTYRPEEEYEIRKKIKELIGKLERPNHYLNIMKINVYHELINYLKEEEFAGNTLFDLVIEKEKEAPQDALDWIRSEINNGEFYKQLGEKIKAYFEDSKSKKVYLILYGFGSAFPFLRASELLKNTECLMKEFKMIVFYPGEYKDSSYHLFNVLDDDNMYRANYLNRQLEETN